MRVWVLLVVLTALVALACDWRDRGRRHVALVPVLALVFGVGGVQEWQWQAADRHYTAVAEQILVHPHAVVVSCQRWGATLLDISQLEGYVPYPGDGSLPTHALLMNDVCKDLRAWLAEKDKSHPTTRQIQSLHVFVHETMHLDGIYNEGLAECGAMANTEKAAELFGAPRGTGQRMALAYYETVFPQMPDDYRGPCPRPSLDGF